MIKSLYKGWNIFKNKNIIYSLILLIISTVTFVLSFEYLTELYNKLSIIITNGSILNTFLFIIKDLGYESIILFILIFVILVLFNYTIVSVSILQNKKKNKLKLLLSKFTKTIKYTFFEFIIYIVLFILFLVLNSFINIFTLILSLLLFIFSIAIYLVLKIGIIFIGIENYDLKKTLKSAWKFLKKRFWLSIFFIILICITISIFVFIVDYLFYLIVPYNIDIIFIGYVIYLIIVFCYTTNSLTIFINKFK